MNPVSSLGYPWISFIFEVDDILPSMPKLVSIELEIFHDHVNCECSSASQLILLGLPTGKAVLVCSSS